MTPHTSEASAKAGPDVLLAGEHPDTTPPPPPAQRDMSGGGNAAVVLADLAKEINEHEDAVDACRVKGLMHGIRIGQLLLEAKKVTPHGGFIPWVKANTKVSQRQAQRYIVIADDEDLVEAVEAECDSVSHLTVRKAVELAGKARREKRLTQKLFDKLSASLAEAEAARRQLARSLGECREQRFKGKDEAFTAWLMDRAGVGRSTAEAAPELLDQNYDDEAWTGVLVEDLSAETADVGQGEAA